MGGARAQREGLRLRGGAKALREGLRPRGWSSDPVGGANAQWEGLRPWGRGSVVCCESPHKSRSLCERESFPDQLFLSADFLSPRTTTPS